MSFNYTNFITIDINKRPDYTASSTRDTVVLIFKDSTISADDIKIYGQYNIDNENIIDYKVAIEEIEKKIKSSEDDTVKNNLNILKNSIEYYFYNNGKKLKIIYTKKDLTDANIIDTINNCKLEEIVFAIPQLTTYQTLEKIINNFNDQSNGALDKIILTSIYKNQEGVIPETVDANNLVYKYGKAGCELSIGAYLSNINIDINNSVKDYAFTTESLVNEEDLVSDNKLAESLMSLKNINFITNIANDNRNIGGDDSNGNSIVNTFVNIMMHQTVSERLMKVLAGKVKYDVNGLNIISANLNQELQRYVSCGYLNTMKQWTDDSWIVNENGINYTVISKNTALDKGFKFVVLPFSSLTSNEKAEHKLPKIYIVIADSYSIRSITISGEII